jgi:hypothetical protein
MDETWVEIKDDCVRHIWKGNCDCDETVIDVSPLFYQNNGTPTCECGTDFIYLRTEIKT